jgi:hypothetical protein
MECQLFKLGRSGLYTAKSPDTEPKTNMRILFYRLLAAAGSVMVVGMSACASSNGSKQSRIERKIVNPETENVQIGTAHYNQYSKGFEEPWPFGPYSN